MIGLRGQRAEALDALRADLFLTLVVQQDMSSCIEVQKSPSLMIVAQLSCNNVRREQSSLRARDNT
jgi:hypothetical protein